MGTFVPLPNGYQVEIVHLLDGVGIENRLWFTFDNPPASVADVQGLTDGVASWWTGSVLPYLSADLFTGFVSAKDWFAFPPPVIAFTTIDLPGGVAAEACSANVGVVVPFRYPIGARLKRNKHYVPGVPEQEVTLNTPSTAIRTALFEAYAALVDAARLFTPVLNWRWVLTSAYEGGAPRTEQLALDCQGVYPVKDFILGQRRKRLPSS